ncbi:hypothetical protein IHE55_09850 [Streptomyces pactum]|uniref:Acyl-CoA carboxylase subunit epsilon n=1 Tax=Streptomyces pactum TaxID=68249 RepID=A0ABS0NIQ3_9ACTN|nr:acyl-CoA carboxylase epsilon subunit [Streptomyces pactum]MBH5335083.1 hypothetical protein [Streptomyces pactum]
MSAGRTGAGAPAPDRTAPAATAPGGAERDRPAPGAPAAPAAGQAAGAPDIDGPLGPSLLKVIRGNPSPDELAAATAVLLALARRAAPADGGGTTATPRWRPAPADGCPPRSWKSRRSPAT